MTAARQSAVVRLRIYPNQEQTKKLLSFCGAARWTYNWALQRWKQRFEEGRRTTAYDLANELVFLKKMEATSWLQEIQAAGLQQSLLQAERAYKNFFKGQSKFPKFKRRGFRDSFSFPQFVDFDEASRKIYLPKIGLVTCRGCRDLTDLKTVTIVREGDGWYACVRTKRIVAPLTEGTRAVGVDMGVIHMATITTENGHGRHFAHHPHLDRAISKINYLNSVYARKQRVSSRNSRNREKVRKKLAKAYAKLSNMRRDHLHKVSLQIVRNFRVIVVEDLKIKNMMRSASGTLVAPNLMSSSKRGLNRSIGKQAWGKFFKMLEYKCLWYGRTFVKVDPRNTSRTCPQCGHISKSNRESQAIFRCVSCRHTANADIVGALNVLRRGLQTSQSP